MKVFTVLFVVSAILSLTTAQPGKQLDHCCQNDLCPADCQRCDGTATCYDLSDELGCNNDTDSALLSYKKPPVFVPFILNILKSKLRQEKMELYRRNPYHACFRTTQVTTTETPVWLQLLRKLQSEKKEKGEQSKVTTMAPLATVTDMPVWKLLLQRLKEKTTTTGSPETTLVDIVTSPDKSTSPDTTTLPNTTLLPVKTTLLNTDRPTLSDKTTLRDISTLYGTTTQPGKTTLKYITSMPDKTTLSDKATPPDMATSTPNAPPVSTSIHLDTSTSSSTTVASDISVSASSETNMEKKTAVDISYSSTTGIPITSQPVISESSTKGIELSSAVLSLNKDSTPSAKYVSTSEPVILLSSTLAESLIEASSPIYASTTSMPTETTSNQKVGGIPVTIMSNERYYSLQQKTVTLPNTNTTIAPEVTSTTLAIDESTTPASTSPLSTTFSTKEGILNQSTETLRRRTTTETMPMMSTDKITNAGTTNHVSDTTIHLDFSTELNENIMGDTTNNQTQIPAAFETTTNPAVPLLELLENMLNDNNTVKTNVDAQKISSFLHGNETIKETVTVGTENINKFKGNISEYTVNNGTKDATLGHLETLTVSLNVNINKGSASISEYSMQESTPGNIDNYNNIIYNASTRDNTVTVSSIVSNEANIRDKSNEMKNQLSTGQTVMSPDNEIKVILGRLHSLLDNEKHNYSSALTLKEFNILTGDTVARDVTVPPTRTATYTTTKKSNIKPLPEITPQPAIWPQTTIPPFSIDNLLGFTSMRPTIKNGYQSSPNPFAWDNLKANDNVGGVAVPKQDQTTSSDTQQSQRQLNDIYDPFKQGDQISQSTKRSSNRLNGRISLNERGTTVSAFIQRPTLSNQVNYPTVPDTYSATTSNPLNSGSYNQKNATWNSNFPKQNNDVQVMTSTPRPFDLNNKVSDFGANPILPVDSISSWWQQVYTTVTPPIYTAPTTTYSHFSDAQQCFEIQDVSGKAK
ncbi:hypothetical protein ACF0H5_000104 [Mactra antiquata]